jgi:putative ABC transport system permease protein
MQIRPVITALRRHKAGTVLIALQVALTLAIVCNAVFLIRQSVSKLSEPVGVDSRDLFVVRNEWVGQPANVDELIRTDIAMLRQLPQVAAAYASESEPLSGSGWDSGVMLAIGQQRESAHAALYFDDEQSLDVLGTPLIAGRQFRAEEVGTITPQDSPHPPVVIVTQKLARHLFPQGSALGRTIYLGTNVQPSTIIGLVDHLHTQYTNPAADHFADESVVMPLRLLANHSDYIVRARPGQLREAMAAARKQLFALNGARVIDTHLGVLSFDELRNMAYARDRGMAQLLGAICLVLLAVTAAGIVGLTTFWVGQRRRQIGIRRALGARQRDILSYFLTENFLISSGGVVLGSVLALALNLWMVAHFAQSRLPLAFVGIGVLTLLVLGQLAVLAPALRASHVPPVEATR